MSDLRVFAVDDHAILREGLRALVDAQAGMTFVGEAADGLTACELVPALDPDVVVTDVCMPGLSGVQLTARLRCECPRVRVLVLTFREDRGCLLQVLAAGATGYLLKQATGTEELVGAIRAVAAGRVYLDPSVAGKVVGAFVRSLGDESGPAADLSERENGVARLTAAGFSNKEIAARYALSIKTVETYRARAMGKLGLTNRVGLVRYAAQSGWFQDG